MNELRLELLKLLYENQTNYLSGEKISQLLGVSRTAIWKHIKQLREQGYEIDSLTRKGYQLRKTPEKISAEEVYLNLKTEIIGQEIMVFTELASSNDKARQLARAGHHEGLVVLTEKQTAGKGRLGRKWYSPIGRGLWFSVIVRPTIQPNQAPFLTIIASLALYHAIRKVDEECEVSIKWPNDILLADKKVCGILSELSADLGGINYAIIGIGVNVNQVSFPAEIVKIGTSLYQHLGYKVDRIELLQQILHKLEQYYRKLLAGKGEEIIAEWKGLLNIIGRRVKIVNNNEHIYGIVEEISSQGELVLRDDQGLCQTFWAGDVSLRQGKSRRGRLK